MIVRRRSIRHGVTSPATEKVSRSRSRLTGKHRSRIVRDSRDRNWAREGSPTVMVQLVPRTVGRIGLTTVRGAGNLSTPIGAASSIEAAQREAMATSATITGVRARETLVDLQDDAVVRYRTSFQLSSSGSSATFTGCVYSCSKAASSLAISRLNRSSASFIASATAAGSPVLDACAS